MSLLGNIAALLGLTLALGCHSSESSESKRAGAGDKPPPADEPPAPESKHTSAENTPPGDEGADDGSVDILVPMGLWDPDSFAEVVKSIPLTLSGTLQLPASPTEVSSEALEIALPTFKAEGLTAIAGSVQGVPAAMTSVMRELLARLVAQLRDFVGEGGLYADQEITIKAKNGKGSITFEVYAPNVPSANQPGYAVLSYDEEASFPFALDVYEKAAADGSTYRRMARWEFKELAGGTLALRAKVAQPMDQTHTSHFVLEHTQGEKRVRLLAGSSGVDSGSDRLVIDYDFSDTWAMVQGAYSIAGAPALTLPGLPRYAAARKGDAHLFRSLAEVGSPQGEAIQELAFVPVEDALAASYRFDATRFASAGYLDMGLAAIANLLQDPLLNPSCASTGSQLRAKLTSDAHPVPQSLVDAPESFCAADAAISARKVAEVVYDICWVSLPEGVPFTTTAAGVITVDLCESLTAATLLSNPQRVYLDADDKRIVEASSTRPPSLDAFLARGPEGALQQALHAQMTPATFPDVSFLAESSWPEEITKKVSEFAGATVLRK